MPHLEPTYLRYIYDGLIKGSIHPENAAELPAGLIGMYEEAFDERTSVVERQKLLQRFAIWALLKKEVSAAFVAEVLGETEDDIQEFISTYSAWFNSPESGKYQLYHERLKVYLLQKLGENTLSDLLANLSRALKTNKKIKELKIYKDEWQGFNVLLNGELKAGLKFLNKNINKQHENWWGNTIDLFFTIIGIGHNYQITQKDFDFFTRIKSRNYCNIAAKIILKNFEIILWDEFAVDSSSESRFHYVLAEMMNRRFEEFPSSFVCNIILDETHYLSYTMAYAWKYHCWTNEKVLYPEVVEEIKKKGSPYLRILLRQIDGGRRMLNLNPILKNIDYAKDCWEYVSEDFLVYLQSGKELYLNKFLNNFEFETTLKDSKLEFLLEEFDSLHVMIDRIEEVGNTIQKSPFFYQIIEILWLHPAWEIGEIANDFVRNKLNSTKDETEITECVNWIYQLSSEKNTYSIAILIFDIIDVIDVSNEYVMNIMECIFSWNDAQVRGQLISSANDFFRVNNDPRWLVFMKEVFYKLCEIASDIWETQEIIDLLKTLKNRLTEDEINDLLQKHRLLNKIPNAPEMDWLDLWRIAEKMRLNGEI
jgi:hypothetical protein